jgi:two-component system, response regulator YesN
VEDAAASATVFDLIIVDDEPAILEGLERTYDWDRFGFRVVGTAKSGEQALSLVYELNPDVVMTDIQMRRMGGLELIERCQEYDPALEFVIVSAHDDFIYAQQACALGVFSYLLKPIDDEQIRSVMIDLHALCGRSRDQILQIDQYRLVLTERKQELEQQLLRNLLVRAVGMSEFVRQLRVLESELADSQSYCVVCLDVDVSVRILGNVNMDAHRYLLTRGVIGQISEHYNLRSFELSDGRVVIVVVDPRNDLSSDSILSGMMRRITRNSETGSRLIISAGRFSRGFAGLCRSFDQAIASFEYRAAVDKDGEMAEGHAGALRPQSMTYPRQEALNIIRSIRLNDIDLLSRHLQVFDRACADCERDARSLCFQRLCNEICFYLLETAGMLEWRIDKLSRYTEHVFRLTDDEMARVLDEIICEIIVHRQEYHMNRTTGAHDRRIKDALLFLDGHLGKERLTIRDAADSAHLNVAYFGRLFRKTTGMSFNEHLSRKRTEKAAELLNGTDMNVQEIAEQVGIPNSSYFSTVFKKNTGMSPSEYRRHE